VVTAPVVGFTVTPAGALVVVYVTAPLLPVTFN
jgi:hypothetical protein